MSIDSEAQRLRALRDSVAAASVATIAPLIEWVNAAAQAVQLILGHSAKSGEVMDILEVVSGRLRGLHETLVQVSAELGDVADHHDRRTRQASEPNPTSAVAVIPRRATAPEPSRLELQGELNMHGDRYPQEAIPYHDFMPPRVRRGQRSSPPMTGWVQLDGQDIGEISATRNDLWAEKAAQRIHALRVPNADQLNNHVEVKVVVMQIEMRRKRGQVVINHAPCGSETGSYQPGCHRTLPKILPEGYTLTVLGTDANGNPFRHTYHGKATR